MQSGQVACWDILRRGKIGSYYADMPDLMCSTPTQSFDWFHAVWEGIKWLIPSGVAACAFIVALTQRTIAANRYKLDLFDRRIDAVNNFAALKDKPLLFDIHGQASSIGLSELRDATEKCLLLFAEKKGVLASFDKKIKEFEGRLSKREDFERIEVQRASDASRDAHAEIAMSSDTPELRAKANAAFEALCEMNNKNEKMARQNQQVALKLIGEIDDVARYLRRKCVVPQQPF